MSKDSPKDIYSKCIACDSQKLKVVYKEVGGCDIDFQALLKYGAETGSKERQESVLLLKTKVHELKDYLKELEGDPPPPQETPSDEYVKYQMSNDRKMIWRLELERRMARKKAEKDISPLEQECFELRKRLYDEKNRFKELIEEFKLLRRELERMVEKNEEDVKIMNSYKTLETQLQESLAERAAIRNGLAFSLARNKRLTEEIAVLKEELHTLQKKTCDNNELIESLTICKCLTFRMTSRQNGLSKSIQFTGRYIRSRSSSPPVPVLLAINVKVLKANSKSSAIYIITEVVLAKAKLSVVVGDQSTSFEPDMDIPIAFYYEKFKLREDGGILKQLNITLKYLDKDVTWLLPNLQPISSVPFWDHMRRRYNNGSWRKIRPNLPIPTSIELPDMHLRMIYAEF